MPRIRTIKPGFWTDEKLAQLPPLVRMTFLGLISAMADDAGRCKGDVRLVKAAVWPLDDDVSTRTVASHLDQLCKVGRIVIYEVGGARYIQVVNWKKHQRIDKPRPSELPAPPDDGGSVVDYSANIPRIVVDDSTLEAEREVEGNRKGSGADTAGDPRDEIPADPPSSAPPAPLLSALALPKGVIDFLAMFYEPAFTERQRERYRDIVAQLWETIDPRHAGPKIRGGIRVKARDQAHLERECRAVMSDPPIDRDKAVVIVLKRLTNPPPGPTPAEQHKAATDAAVAEEDAYQHEARSAGVRWAKEHPEEYEPIRAEIEQRFKQASPSAFTDMAKQSALTQKCSAAAGFPDFETWRAARRDVA